MPLFKREYSELFVNKLFDIYSSEIVISAVCYVMLIQVVILIQIINMI